MYYLSSTAGKLATGITGFDAGEGLLTTRRQKDNFLHTITVTVLFQSQLQRQYRLVRNDTIHMAVSMRY